MGCFNSKSTSSKGPKDKNASKERDNGPSSKRESGKNVPKGSGKESQHKSKTSNRNDNTSSTEPAERFLRSFVSDAESFIKGLPDSAPVKQLVATTFMNSAVETIRTKFRMKFSDILELATSVTEELKLSLLRASLDQVEDRSMDDGYTRLLLAWHSNNPAFEKKISAAAGQAVLDNLYIRYTVSKPVTFEDLMRYHFTWGSASQAVMEVFTKFSDGKEIFTTEQLAKYLRETQRTETTSRQLAEKYKYRFGGGIHRYNFATYVTSVLTNSSVDPSRTTTVWQDMTQPLTRYMVGCTRVEKEEDLNRAIADGTRALMLNLRRGDNGVILSGACPLQTIVKKIKADGFTTNTYPIVLRIAPKKLPRDVQTDAANIISTTLDSLLAKGLMFEGAVITDPKFSPSALRKRVLVLSEQTKLKAFVGFMVADMNKDGLGVRVTEVLDNTPASKAGIVKDDWLTHVNATPVGSKDELRRALASISVGEEFTVKRENLDEVKVAMGGAVDPNAAGGSAEMSGLTFLTYSNAATHKPWEVEEVDAEKLPLTSLTRKDIADHFALVCIDSNGKAKMPDYEGIASRIGIQFIDTDNTERCLAWSRGRFCDNGRCGYLLRTDTDPEESSDLTINIIGGPRVLNSPPLSTAAVLLHGSGSVRHSGSQITFSACDHATVAVVRMTFETNGEERTFTASFSPAIIRAGYRALPAVAAGEERSTNRKVHSIFCFAKLS